MPRFHCRIADEAKDDHVRIFTDAYGRHPHRAAYVTAAVEATVRDLQVDADAKGILASRASLKRLGIVSATPVRLFERHAPIRAFYTIEPNFNFMDNVKILAFEETAWPAHLQPPPHVP